LLILQSSVIALYKKNGLTQTLWAISIDATFSAKYHKRLLKNLK